MIQFYEMQKQVKHIYSVRSQIVVIPGGESDWEGA